MRIIVGFLLFFGIINILIPEYIYDVTKKYDKDSYFYINSRRIRGVFLSIISILIFLLI